MSEREAFGPNLRRIRLQRGISIHEIVAHTNVSASLWEGLERNDFARWPAGIYARSYVRSYATIIGTDPEPAVDEFCRWFSQGDRRAELVIRGHAEIIGHMDLQWRDQMPPAAGDSDRRGAAATERPAVKPRASPAAAFAQLFVRLRALLRA